MRVVSLGALEPAWVYAEDRAYEVQSVMPPTLPLPWDSDPALHIYRADARDLLKKGSRRIQLLNSADILHFTLNGITKRPLMDAIAVSRRIQPKLLVVCLPSAPPPDHETSALDFVMNKDQYRARFVTLTASSFGACVAKSFRFLIAIRIDYAKRLGIRNNADVAQLLPRPTHTHPSHLDVALGKATSTGEEQEFWSRRLRNSPKLYHLSERMNLDPKKAIRQKTLVRGSRYAALPVPRVGDLILHPLFNRSLTSTELAAAWGYPAQVKLRGSFDERFEHVQNSVPFPLIRALKESFKKYLENAEKKNPLTINHVQDRFILEDNPERRVYALPEDLGDAAGKQLHGKPLSSAHYDYLFDADKIGKDFIVYGPADVSGRPVLIGAVRRRAYKITECKEFAEVIASVREGTDARMNEAPLQISEADIRARETRGYEVDVTKDRRQFCMRKKGTEKWGRWRTLKILSTTYGWTLDKNTDEPKKTKNYEKYKASLRRLLKIAERAYLRIEKDEFIKHAEMMRRRVDRRYRLIPGGLFTTLAINCYGREMPSMNYHIDSNGDESGLATISVFKKGEYDGGYFVLPQYRAAFSIGHGDVFLSNSRKTHGVTSIVGSGNRLSVVSYASTALAADEWEISAHPAKSPRPKFRVSDYQIAIPSYKRERTLVTCTLAVLKKHKIDPKRVTIFVANEAERVRYAVALEATEYRNLVVAEPGMARVRNFMWNYYSEGTPVLFVDDDIQAVQKRIKPKGQNPKLVEVGNLELDVIYAGFDRMREHSAYLWGIYAAANPGFMKERVAIGLYYVIGSFYGAIIRHSPDLLVGTDDKEDFERSIQHFLKDGRVARLDYLTVKSAYYTQPGGMQVQRTKKTVSAGAEYMLQNYPLYVRDKGNRLKGQHKGNREITLRETD